MLQWVIWLWLASGSCCSCCNTAVGQTPDLGDKAEASNVDLEELADDRIVRLIEARFKGYVLALLVGGRESVD